MTQLAFIPSTVPFVPKPSDWNRWKGHKRAMLMFLRDGMWHSRDSITEAVGTKGFTGRISGLREAGYLIECSRVGDLGDTAYRIIGFTGVSNVNTNHCPTCSCSKLQF